MTARDVALGVQIAFVGFVGLLAMAGAIFVGVYLGAWVGIGAEARQQKSFIWWIVNRLLFLAAVGSIQSFAQYYLADVLHVPKPASATTMLMAAVAGFLIPSALGGGYLADRIGRKRLVMLAGLVAAGGTVLLLFAIDDADGHRQRVHHRPGRGNVYGDELGAGHRSRAQAGRGPLPGHLEPGGCGRGHRRRGHRRADGRLLQRAATGPGLSRHLRALRGAVCAVVADVGAGRKFESDV